MSNCFAHFTNSHLRKWEDEKGLDGGEADDGLRWMETPTEL